jgi:hypothetical protein
VQSSPDEFYAVAKANPNIVHCSTNNSENNNLMSNNEFGEGKSSSGEFSLLNTAIEGKNIFIRYKSLKGFL